MGRYELYRLYKIAALVQKGFNIFLISKGKFQSLAACRIRFRAKKISESGVWGME